MPVTLTDDKAFHYATTLRALAAECKEWGEKTESDNLIKWYHTLIMIAEALAPPDLPETSRSSHYS